jgi:hypothetical protein
LARIQERQLGCPALRHQAAHFIAALMENNDRGLIEEVMP